MSSDSDSIELHNDKDFGVTTEYRFVMVPHWLLEMTVDEEPLPSSAIHLYNCLMYFANKERDCFPSYDTLENMKIISVFLLLIYWSIMILAPVTSNNIKLSRLKITQNNKFNN